MSKVLYTLLILCFSITVSATVQDDVAAANNAYRNADYHKAIHLYNGVLKNNISAEVYYNLGNAYYRTDNIAKALLYYEKAAKMYPMNKDIRHNIEIAQGKTIDKLPPETSMFFVKWYRNLQSWQTVNGWAYIATASLIMALLLFLVYLFMNNIQIRRIAFYLSALLLVMFVFCNIFAWQRYNTITEHDAAIVMKNAAMIKTSPTAKATNACVIHEGTKVRITDNDIKGWYGIQLSDGREGWILQKDVEEI